MAWMAWSRYHSWLTVVESQGISSSIPFICFRKDVCVCTNFSQWEASFLVLLDILRLSDANGHIFLHVHRIFRPLGLDISSLQHFFASRYPLLIFHDFPQASFVDTIDSANPPSNRPFIPPCLGVLPTISSSLAVRLHQFLPTNNAPIEYSKYTESRDHAISSQSQLNLLSATKTQYLN